MQLLCNIVYSKASFLYNAPIENTLQLWLPQIGWRFEDEDDDHVLVSSLPVEFRKL